MAGDKLQDLVAYIASSWVDEPAGEDLWARRGDRATVLDLEVAPDDLGKVIGKEGRTARAMRTLLAATSARMHKRAILDILE